MMEEFKFPFQSLKAIIFDFDGVILESANIKTQAFLDLFADYPQHQAAILQYHLANLGISRYDKFAWIYRELLQRPFTPAERERLGAAFSTIVMDKLRHCPFVPGALETLQSLQENCLAFVASGTPQEELEWVIQHRNLADYFVEVWGTPSKKTEIVRDILRRFQLQAQEVLFVGDGVSDYQAALETGILFIARETPEQVQAWRALNIQGVTDLRQLYSFVGTAETAKLEMNSLKR